MLTNIFSVALLLSSASASCLHGTSLMPRRLAKRAGEVEVSNFGYTGLTGPLNWHNIEADNALCNTGSNQSPINIGKDLQGPPACTPVSTISTPTPLLILPFSIRFSPNMTHILISFPQQQLV